jgi:actin-like protein 6A
MFEKYQVPAFFLAKDAVLSAYSLGLLCLALFFLNKQLTFIAGRTTGLSIDIGNNGTIITPVLDGWAEVKNMTRSIIGGRYLDAYVLTLLKSKGTAFSSSFDK